MPLECTSRILTLLSFIICKTFRDILMSICEAVLSTLPHPETSSVIQTSLITFEGVANDAKSHCKTIFNTL